MPESLIRSASPANAEPRLQAAIVRRVFVVSFFAPPTRSEVDELERDLTDARRRLGPPIHYLGIVDGKSDVPSPEVRKALSSFGRTVSSVCETAHLVVEGEGFRSAVQRSVVTAIHVLKGQRVRCYKSLPDACTAIAELVDASAGWLEAELRRAIAP